MSKDITFEYEQNTLISSGKVLTFFPQGAM